jgi:kinesin family protein 20
MFLLIAELGELLTDERNHEETTVDIEAQGQIKFSVWISFAEIYNENIHDLLEPMVSKKRATKTRPMLQLRDDKKGLPYARGGKSLIRNNNLWI